MDKLKDTLRVFVVPTEILDEELDIYEKMTYMVLRSYANGQDDTAFPSYDTIAKKGSMSRRKAIACVAKLVDLGLIAKEERLKVSKNKRISNTSNLYTIYRPSEIKNKKVVHDMHHPSAHDAPQVVHDMHHPSAQHAPKNNYLKELDLKKEEEELITLDDVQSFLNAQIQKREITNQKTLTAIFEVAEKCRAIGTNDREAMENYCIKVIEEKMKMFGQKQRAATPTGGTKQKKPVRTEKLPEWFDKEEKAEQQEDDLELKKQEVKIKMAAMRSEITEEEKEEMLRQLRSNSKPSRPTEEEIQKNKQEIQEMLKQLRGGSPGTVERHA